MSRPSFVKTGSKLELKVPPGWFLTIAAISRESYSQLIGVTDDLYGFPSTEFIGSKHKNNELEAMKGVRSGSDSIPYTAQSKAMNIDLQFYYTSNRNAAKNLVSIGNPQNQSFGLDILQVDKPDTAPPSIPDYTTLMIFVEDTKDEAVAGHGKYDDAVATVHFVKKAPKPAGADDGDDD